MFFVFIGISFRFENAQTVNINIKTYTGRYNVEISEENPEEEILSNENSEEENSTEIQESEGEE